MKARWYQMPHSDHSRSDEATAFFRALFPKLAAPGLLLLTNLALNYWDYPYLYTAMESND